MKATMEQYLVWWVNQVDCEAIGEKLNQALPTAPVYLQTQYISRYGRGGRGRLWISPLLNLPSDVAIDPWPSTPLGEVLAGDYGGIVIKAEDAPWALPGVITDLKLRRVYPITVER